MKVDIRAAVRAELAGAAEHAELARWTDEELRQCWAATHNATAIAAVVSDRVSAGEKPLARPGRKAGVRGPHQRREEMVRELVEPDGAEDVFYAEVLQAIADQLNTWALQNNAKVNDLHGRLHAAVSDCVTIARDLGQAVRDSNVD